MTIKTRGQQVRLFDDGFNQRAHFRGLRAVIEGRDELNRGAQVCQICFQLGSGSSIKHLGSLSNKHGHAATDGG